MLLASAAHAYDPGSEEPSEPLPEPPPVSEPEKPQLTWGDLLWLGGQCKNWDETPTIATPYRLHLPLRNWIKREDGSRSLVGTCQFSLPLKVPTGYRLVIYALSAQGITDLAPSTEATLRTEILFSTDKKLSVADEQQAFRTRASSLNVLTAEDELVGGCGQSWILKGYTETRIRGGKGLSIATVSQIAIDYELQKCNEPDGL